MNKLTFTLLSFAVTGIAVTACTNDDTKKDTPEVSKVVLKNYSETPALLKKLSGFENVETYTLISSNDEFTNYRFGGSADGIGMIKNPAGGFVMFVNNEDNYSVSRVELDETLKPVKGSYALNSDGGQWRLCSGTMVTPEEHGFGPYYFSVGESNVEAMTHKIDPFQNYILPNNTSRGIPALGHWSGENSVPLNKNAYPGKTVIVMGEDASDATGGQMAMYVASAGDLNTGSLYMLKRVDGVQKETDMTVGKQYDVEFAKIDNHLNLTGAQIQALVDPLKAIKFGRVEDVDYRKGSGTNAHEVYFNVTGQDPSGDNADKSRTVWGRVYRITLDATNPLKGKLEVILDGDDDNGPAKDFQNPDNICVTQNYVYVQEDSNGYGTETHDAYIYQYNIATKELKKVFELDHRRNAADAVTYNGTSSSTFGSWEYGGLIDISSVVGIDDVFALCIQPHTWKSEKFAGVDGGSKRKTENQGSEVVILKGLPR
ncbi:hypothetical protein NF867_08260 [Solitalea sp. MAHUQ-68]|uniref:Phosphatase n=1 Tax=Solitalea agri TaxID=2953739 RepID=A0A9X2F2C9_9SPHI|nr:hypothetical protein [Solitalea agri]MCO4292850.1 hypothetical protein [Solitalea agri]